MKKRKIWWQSSTRDGGFPAYKAAVEAHAKRFLGPEFSLEMHGVPYGTSELGWLSFKTMNDHEVLRSMLEANDAGFDAIALGCFQDPAMEEARELVDIPVFGMCEMSVKWAQLYGKRPAIINYDRPCSRKSLLLLQHRYGVLDSMVPTVYYDMPLDLLGKAFDDPGKVIDLSLEAAEQAVEQGADVIMPGCGLLNLILANNGINRVPGTQIPIMDVTAVLMKAIESAVILREETGLQIGRGAFYEKPDARMIEAVRDIYYNR